MKFTFTAAGQATSEFPMGSDINAKGNSRFRILHPDLAGSDLVVEQLMSDEEWYPIFLISSNIEDLG